MMTNRKRSSLLEVTRRFLHLAIAMTMAGSSAPVLGRPGDRSADGLWLEVDAASVTVLDAPYQSSGSQSFRVFRVDMNALDNALADAPLRFTPAAAPATVAIPMPDGNYQRFRIYEDPILSPELAERNPHIKTYWGRGIDDETATARFGSIGGSFHGIIHATDGTKYVNAVTLGDPTHYVSYAAPPPEPFECLTRQLHLDEPPRGSRSRKFCGLLSRPTGRLSKTLR